MAHIIFENRKYELVFIGDDIVLQSQDQDVVFKDARIELASECKIFFRHNGKYANEDQIAIYENEKAVDYCQQNKSKGVIQTYEI